MITFENYAFQEQRGQTAFGFVEEEEEGDGGLVRHAPKPILAYCDNFSRFTFNVSLLSEVCIEITQFTPVPSEQIL